MSVDSFIDTNVFIYSLERLEERKAERMSETGFTGWTGYVDVNITVDLGSGSRQYPEDRVDELTGFTGTLYGT